MTESQLMLFAGDSPASPSVLQVSKEVQMMIDTFGLKCSGLSKKSALDGLLVKMFQDSSAWHSTMCRLTWSVRATKSGRLYWELSPKMLTTEEIESGLSQELWATPNTMDGLPPRSPEGLQKLAEGHRKGRTRPSNLREQVDEETMALWPTPQDSDGSRGPCKPDDIQRTSSGFSRTAKDGVKFGAKLVSAVNAVQMWTTPAHRDYRSPHKEGSEAFEKRKENSRGVPLTEELQRRGEKGRLNPDWVEVLMGYPVGWTDLEKDVEHNLTEFVGNPDDSGEPRVTLKTDGRAQRLKQLGNSIVPQVAAELFKAIKDASE